MKIYVFGDIHGEAKKLKEVYSKLNLEFKDFVVFLGDYIDRGKESFEVIEFLIKLKKERKKTILLRGNHEEFLFDYVNNGKNTFELWELNGGRETLKSYIGKEEELKRHTAFLKENCIYSFQIEKYFFCHSGGNVFKKRKDQTEKDLTWVRDANNCLYPSEIEKEGFLIVYGHTPSNDVVMIKNRICIDTGACFKGGKLTCIELPTKTIYQA